MGKNTPCHFPLVLQALKKTQSPSVLEEGVCFFGAEDYIIIIESHINLLQVEVGKCQDK